MSLILYHGEPNGPSLSVLAALAEAGVDAERVHIDLARGARHRTDLASTEVTMSVEGEGPVLVADGVAMADSVFIACYLDDAFPGSGLRPKDPYARWEMMAWCRQIIERCAPAAAFLGTRAYLHGDLARMDDAAFAALTASIASEDLRQRWADVRAGVFPAGQDEDSRAKIGQTVQKVEDRLADGRDWLMGDFTIADLETFAWLAGMVELVPEAFTDAARTRAWMERMRARPSVHWALSCATADRPERVWAPGPEINRWG